MGEARESEELGRERDYLSARLEETSRELARLDLQNASLSLERRQAVVAFRFIGLLHERAEEAATVEGLYRRVVEAITVDLSADAAALLRIDPQTGDVSVVAAAGLPEDAEFSGLSAASPGCDLTRPTFVNSKSTLRPFHDVVRSRARLPYFVWYPITGEPDGLWVLFAANRMEDLQLKHPFSEATLEIGGQKLIRSVTQNVSECMFAGIKIDQGNLRLMATLSAGNTSKGPWQVDVIRK